MQKHFGFILICGLIIGDATTSSVEDLQSYYANIVRQCLSDNPLSPSDMASTGDRSASNPALNCLFACAFKHAGMLDEQGNLSVDGVRKITEQYLGDNPEMMKKSEQFTEACISVNDEPVTDGTKGCDRANLIYKCSLEKAPGFGVF